MSEWFRRNREFGFAPLFTRSAGIPRSGQVVPRIQAHTPVATNSSVGQTLLEDSDTNPYSHADYTSLQLAVWRPGTYCQLPLNQCSRSL